MTKGNSMTMTDDKAPLIRALDFTAITDDLVRDGMERGEAERAIRYYREFLIAGAAHPGATLVPSKLVDRAWHAHMNRPALYLRDCLAVFGTILDHTPGVYGTPEWLAAYDRTRELVSYGADMPADPLAVLPMAGAECFRPPLAGAECFRPPLQPATASVMAGADCFRPPFQPVA